VPLHVGVTNQFATDDVADHTTSTIVRMGQVVSAPKRSTLRYWYAGMAIDLIHMPLVIALVVAGAVWFSGPVYVAIVTIVVVLQVALLGCPCMALTGWLKRKHDPNFRGQWSLTVWLYHQYGRTVGIAVFVFFLGTALALRALFW
jgi:hypothetical protein